MSFGNSDCAVYSDLNPLDGGQSLYPMSAVYASRFKLPIIVTRIVILLKSKVFTQMTWNSKYKMKVRGTSQ